jgi:hypothetical protein
MRAMLSRAMAARWWGWAALACLLSSAAPAQPSPGPSGSPTPSEGAALVRPRRWALSLERLVGYAAVTRSGFELAPGVTDRERAVSLLGIPALCSTGFGCSTFMQSAFELPRLGLDYFVRPRTSVGLAAALVVYPETVGGDGFSSHPVVTVEVAPRIGYSYAFNDWIGVWTRAGVSYVRASREVPHPESLPEGSFRRLSAWALTLEALVVITPQPDWAVTVGPNADVGVAGSAEQDASSFGFRTTDLGLHAGLAVFF